MQFFGHKIKKDFKKQKKKKKRKEKKRKTRATSTIQWKYQQHCCVVLKTPRDGNRFADKDYTRKYTCGLIQFTSRKHNPSKTQQQEKKRIRFM